MAISSVKWFFLIFYFLFYFFFFFICRGKYFLLFFAEFEFELLMFHNTEKISKKKKKKKKKQEEICWNSASKLPTLQISAFFFFSMGKQVKIFDLKKKKQKKTMTRIKLFWTEVVRTKGFALNHDKRLQIYFLCVNC